MNEQPKSIWKKPWKGWRGDFLWFVLLAAAAFVVIFCIGLIAGNDSGFLIAALVASVCIALAFLFIRWLCNWRNFRRFLFGVACVITIIALFYAEENWRGKHAWKKFKAEGGAKGEKFDLVSIAPPPVPNEQNFATTPIIASTYAMWFDTNGNRHPYDTNVVSRLQIPTELGILNFTNRIHGWQQAEKMDLKAWQQYYRDLATLTNFFPVALHPQPPEKDVLLALSRYDSTIEELRAASKLHHSRFPLGYTDADPAGILLPHLAPLKVCAITLRLRATAESQSDQTEKALDDIKLMFRLIDSVRAEPFLISHLVRIAMWQIAMQPIWEGLADHKWTDVQLAALDAELGKLDFLADYQVSTRGERALGIGVIDFLRRNRKQIPDHVGMAGWSFDDDGKSSHPETKDSQIAIFMIAPSGWFEQNKISSCRMHSEYYLPVVNLETRVFSFTVEKQASETLDTLFTKRSPYGCFTRLLLPSFNKASRKFVQAQSFTDMARVAIALERYRLTHGDFPETLDALAPQFMEKVPHDIIGGKPLKYRRSDPPSPGSSGAAGQFVLYSVGSNETDDGGKVGLTEKGNVDWKQGDWVWQYPPPK